jgi:hypothetical protein
MLRVSDFVGSTTGIETALSRLVAEGAGLLRVRPGLYWKGVTSRFGVVPPSVFEIALEIAGIGAGPAGVAAARALGLTTQVPSVVEIAAPGRVPRPLKGARFRQRGCHRRELGLHPLEVALIETLKQERVIVEVSPAELTARVRELVDEGKIRLAKLRDALARERDVEARTRFTDMEKAIVGAPAR